MFWWVDDGPRAAGRIELSQQHVALAATTPTPIVEHIAFNDLAHILLERGTMHLERHGLPTVHVRSLDTPGALRELHDRLLVSRCSPTASCS